MKDISDWNGASGGTRDNYPELVAKCQENFRELFRTNSSRDNVAFFDDFLGDVLQDEWAITAGSDSPAAGALVESVYGKLRLTTGDSNASLAADGIQACSFLNFKTLNGATLEARLQVSAITNLQLFVGLTDQRAALEMPATLSGTTYTTVATDAVGFMFDTAATVDTIRAVGVANDVDATHVDTGIAYVAATDILLRIEVDTLQTARFYINNSLVATVASALRGTIPLTFVICARSAGDTVAKNVDVDYIGVSIPRV
jgi:hypothetical protein